MMYFKHGTRARYDTTCALFWGACPEGGTVLGPFVIVGVAAAGFVVNEAPTAQCDRTIQSFSYQREPQPYLDYNGNLLVWRDAYKLEVTKSPPMAVTDVVSCQNEGIHYKKNEVCILGCDRKYRYIIRSEVVGALKMKTCLSGMPECKLGLNDRFMMDAQHRAPKGKPINLEDIRFHQ
ncbi:AP-1 complex subunit mu-1 [Artemisia annua]|uniref:AP-1 complex subunit mu-1 n=1 Tax=Artemisia annua TaxID=35608 RepID=A0A2U1QIZ0_ARTAN|nr:AP-1 complex subunit mu-1 [Artemisia annua]